MKILNKFHPYILINDIVRCFVSSCGLALLVFFFYYEKIPFEKTVCTRAVLLIFMITMTILAMFEICGHHRWFADTSITSGDAENMPFAEHVLKIKRWLTIINK